MDNEMRQEMRCEASMRDRILHVVDQWETSLTFFCLVFGFFCGLIFVLNPWLPAFPEGRGYGWWPSGYLTVIGVVFMLLTAYAALYPERHGAYMAISVIAGIGLITAFHPFNVIAFGFWILALVTVGAGVVRNVRAVRREAGL
jgi:hypothetical protein